MKSRRKLSDANLEIMNVVWKKGREVSINEVFEAVNAERQEKVTRSTVQVQMRRLEAYGWLTHRKHNREFVYSALREEAEAKRGMLRHLRDRVFGGSTADLVKCLFEAETLTPAELRRLRELLERRPKE
ncbi:MAG: BlaI/MecI/CopY family transcriptional regulator [Candidatus Aminicenantales bacterium]